MNNPDAENLDLNLLNDLFDPKKDPSHRFEIINNFSHKLMPEWFLPMLNDEARNTYYSKMLNETVKDKIVIDLGSGTGMWTIEALAKGARFVYVVERNPILVKYLEFIFTGHPVKVIAKAFDELTIRDFDRGGPEALVHEIFSNIGLGEGVISAFQKVSEIFPGHKLDLFPRYFWFEARVVKEAPLKLSKIEENHLKEKADNYYELIYSLGIREWVSLKNMDLSHAELVNVMYLDLNKIERKSYTLEPIPVDVTPGLVHRVYLSFKFSDQLEGPFFDTLKEENHWGGFMVEFYASKSLPAGRKYLKMKLNDNQLIDYPILEDRV